MNPKLNMQQLSLFEESERSEKISDINANDSDIIEEKEAKVISLRYFILKKAEERYNSYSDHILQK